MSRVKYLSSLSLTLQYDEVHGCRILKAWFGISLCINVHTIYFALAIIIVFSSQNVMCVWRLEGGMMCKNLLNPFVFHFQDLSKMKYALRYQ